MPNMLIPVMCPGCQSLFQLPEELAGKLVRCQKCDHMFDVPERTAEDVPAVAPLEPKAVKPAKRQPPPKESWSGVLISLALLFLFTFGLCGIGSFAGTWIATHLSPPPSKKTVVPPLHIQQDVKEIPKVMPKF